MDPNALKNVGQTVGLNLYERTWTGMALVMSDGADLADVHAAIAERWRSLLAAMSSGIAHMDYGDPETPAREEALREYERVAIVKPGAAVPPYTKRCVVFLAVEDPPTVNSGTSVAYAVAKLPETWRKALADANVHVVETVRELC